VVDEILLVENNGSPQHHKLKGTPQAAEKTQDGLVYK
jgi:hypothetical protein